MKSRILIHLLLFLCVVSSAHTQSIPIYKEDLDTLKKRAEELFFEYQDFHNQFFDIPDNGLTILLTFLVAEFAYYWYFA